MKTSILPLLLASSLAHAQQPTVIALTAPAAELRETFTRVLSVRELSDGRVYVTDPSDKGIAFVDFQRNTLMRVARAGAGPGEYGRPGRLFAGRGDTTIMFDTQNDRLLLLLPDGKAGAIRSADTPDIGAASLRFVDELGRIYLTATPWGAAGNAAIAEKVVRYNPDTKRVDTLASVGRPPGRSEGARTMGGGMLRLMNNKPFAKEDAVAFGRDGRVAVVRGADYHVDWYNGATHVSGPPVAYKPIAITTAERRAFLERLTVPGQISVTGPGTGGQAVPVDPGMRAPSSEIYDDTGMEWPTHMPAFIGGAATMSPNGVLWVLRTRAQNDSIPRYDVFDGTGRISLTVTLPVRSRIVGFGANSVFVARMDADDLEHLQRFSVPRAR